MRRRILGATGISVSEFALGTMMFGAMGNTDHDESIRIIRTALAAGINFVDTANVYSGGESEEIVGNALKGRRDDVVLATKFRLPMGADANTGGGSRRTIVQSVEASLRRLDTDRIDLYQMHRADSDTSLDETLSALSDLIHAGKVLAIGSSSYPVETIVEAQWVAEKGGHRRFLIEQPRYSILNRQIETAILPTTLRYGIGVLTYGPLASGWLSGRTDPASGRRAARQATTFDLNMPENQAKVIAVQRLTELAAATGLSLTQLATAFVRAHPAVTSVIIGPRTPEQLDDLLTGADIELSTDVLDRIDEIVPPGVELNPADNYHTTPPAISDKCRRRRLVS